MLRHSLTRSLWSFVLLAAFALTLSAPRPAAATPPFYKQWEKIYLTDEAGEDYEKLVKKDAKKCLVCHQGKKKKVRNPYGKHFDELLDKKEKDKEKIVEAIKKVGEMHSDLDDDKSPTYDELIAEGKLPGGELEDLKQEPKEEDGSKKKE